MTIRTIPRNKLQQALDETRKQHQSIGRGYSYGVITQVWDGQAISENGVDARPDLKRVLDKWSGALFADVLTFVDGRLKQWLLPFAHPADYAESIWGNANTLNGRLVKIEYNNNDISTGVIHPDRAWGSGEAQPALQDLEKAAKNNDFSGIL